MERAKWLMAAWETMADIIWTAELESLTLAEALSPTDPESHWQWLSRAWERAERVCRAAGVNPCVVADKFPPTWDAEVRALVDSANIPEPPIEEWIKDDPSLRAGLDRLLLNDRHQCWSRLAAAGFVNRARTHSHEVKLQVVAALLGKGSMPAEWTEIEDWFLALTVEQVERADARFEIVRERVIETLEGLVGGAVDQATWFHLRLDREELACVAQGLSNHPASTISECDLEHLDSLARSLNPDPEAWAGLDLDDIWTSVGCAEAMREGKGWWYSEHAFRHDGMFPVLQKVRAWRKRGQSPE